MLCSQLFVLPPSGKKQTNSHEIELDLFISLSVRKRIITTVFPKMLNDSFELFSHSLTPTEPSQQTTPKPFEKLDMCV